MRSCSDLWMRTALASFSGGAGVKDAKLHGTSGDEFAQSRRIAQTRTDTPAGAKARLDGMGFLSRLWDDIRYHRSLSAEVVSRPPLHFRLIANLLITIFLIDASIAQTVAMDAPNFTDVVLVTGAQLKDRLAKVAGEQNVDVGLKYFVEQKPPLYPNVQGLAELTFKIENKPGDYDLFFIPVSGSDDKADGPKHILLRAEGPTTNKILLATNNAARKRYAGG
jgi:hypothetical protein